MIIKKIFISMLFLFLLTGCKYEINNNVKHPVGPGDGFYLNYNNTYDEYKVIYEYDTGDKLLTNLKIILYDDYGSNIVDIPIEEALNNGYTTIDKLYENWNIYKVYDDESIMYNNGKFYLLKCNTLDGNRNIIIGTEKDVYYLCDN